MEAQAKRRIGVGYLGLADAMANADDKGVWIMPLSPNYFLVEPQFYAMDFAAIIVTAMSAIMNSIAWKSHIGRLNWIRFRA